MAAAIIGVIPGALGSRRASLLLALAFTLLPTVCLYRLLGRLPPFRSEVFKVTLAWFLGQFLSTLAVFVLAIVFVQFTDHVLYKATVLWLFISLVANGFLYRSVDWRTSLRRSGAAPISGSMLVALATCLAFSVLFFSRHLAQNSNQIMTSPAYWDFSVHFPVIQTFAFGDNFPPENESFSGFPMTYHYFFDLLTAIYAAIGMDLVPAVNFVSTVSFFMMLVAIMGIADEIFLSWKIGMIAVVLTVTSSSLAFIPFLAARSSLDPYDILLDIISNRAHPYFFSFVPGNPFGYNGTMFNLFYFVAERQMIVGIILFICCGWLLYRVRSFSPALLVGAGALIGLFLQWHLFITISVVAAVFFLLVLGAERRRMALILLGALPILGLQYLYLSGLTSSPLFLSEIKNYPRLSFEFPTMPGYPLTLGNATGYYLFAYGVKLILAPLSLYFLWKRHRWTAIVLTALIVPTFILVNTIQISPLSVWDNHKWLRPMNVFVDLVIAYALFHAFFLERPILRRAAVIVLLPLLVASGVIELMPFLNSKPTTTYAQYPSSTIYEIRANSEPRAAFLSTEAKELHLAGRKIFAPNSADEPGAISLADAAKMNRAPRDRAAHDIYTATNRATFCSLITRHGVDFVEFSEGRLETAIFGQLADFPRFVGRSEVGETLVFVNARAGCHQ
jgi:hypothetical protein